MYAEGVQDMCSTTLAIAFQPKESKDAFFEEGKKKLLRRYFPVFEKVSQIFISLIFILKERVSDILQL